MVQELAVLGDIGGTNVRFALAEYRRGGFDLLEPFSSPAADYPDVEAALRAYLARVPGARPTSAVLAVAGPVVAGAVRQTNSSWATSEAGLAGAFGLDRALLVNDFAALAFSAPCLDQALLTPLGGPDVAPSADVRAFVGPGTGLGVSALVEAPGGPRAIASEGGHASFAPGSPFECAVLIQAAQRVGRVSYECLLSGRGLPLLHECVSEVMGEPSRPRPAAEILAAALEGTDVACRQTVEVFCSALGDFAGDVALTFGARGGVYLAGGVAQKMRPFLLKSDFRERFQTKPPHERYMAPIPCWLIEDPFAALRGAANFLRWRSPAAEA